MTKKKKKGLGYKVKKTVYNTFMYNDYDPQPNDIGHEGGVHDEDVKEKMCKCEDLHGY